MTELTRIRAQQARYGDWLREHADWRESDEVVDVPGYGLMRKRTAYAGYLMGAEDALKAEALLAAEQSPGGPR